ncbi:MAG: ABC transporter ATP-binding protein [Vicinamibacterales bacterium]
MTAIIAVAPRRAALTMLLTFAVGLAEGIGLLVLIPLLQLVGVDAGQGALGRVMGVFRSGFALVGLVPTLPAVLALYVTIVTVQSLLQRQQTTVQTRLREQIVDTLRRRLHRAIAGTTWVYFSRTRTSTFGQLLTERIDRVASAAYYLMDLFVTGVIALVYVVLAFRVSPVMTTFVVTCGAVLALAMRGQLARAHAAGERYTDASTRLHSATFDHLAGMKMAKGYGAGSRLAERFGLLSSEVGQASLSAMSASVRARQWLTIGSAVLLAAIVYVAQAVMQISAASLLLLIFLFARLVPRVTSLYERAQVLLVELPAFESVVEAEAQCLAAAEPEPTRHDRVTFEASLDCRHVTFSYLETPGRPALEDVTLHVPVHTTTAIVGPSGAGKSTIADLMMGLVTPAHGAVLVDEMPLTPERLQSWRARIGYVAQETLLFHDTIRANLLWACPSATDEAIWQSLERSAAADFVRALPAGLDTVIGDRGVLVSGGERQRLSLARALLRQPQVLILDEATSALDSENEQRIQAAIDGLHEQITIVVITHRLSTIRNADQIYVIEGGRVRECGTWSSLLGNPTSRFRALSDAQGVEIGAA